MKWFTCSLAAGAAVVSFAQPTLDGTRDGTYDLNSVQTVETGFGDNFSELNAAWSQVHGEMLYIVLTGNLEANFNKFNIFFDTVAGGENQITNNTSNGGNNPGNDGWAGKYAGFTFDSAFSADFMLIMRSGNGSTFDIDYAVVGGGASAFETASNIFGGSTTGVNANALSGVGIGVGFNNSNAAGILGGSAAADQAAAEAVTTGIELAIPLAALGNPNGDIRVSAMINGSNHDYLSNQFLGGLSAPQGNLGGDGLGGFNGTVGQLNMNNFAGDQFYTIRAVPEPGTMTVLAIAGLGLLRRRRK